MSVWLSGLVVRWCPVCPGAHRLRPRRGGPPLVSWDGLCWSGGCWQGAEPLPAGEEGILPGPVGADLEDALAGVMREALVVTCGYLRQNIIEDVWADIFDVDQSTISRYITFLTPLVEEATEEGRPAAEEAAEATSLNRSAFLRSGY